MRKICFLSCHNQYDSKRHFTEKFAEALIRRGVDAHILGWSHGPFPEALVDAVGEMKPDLTASFHQLPTQGDGGYFWDRLNIPHWSVLLDPVFYDLELMRSPHSIISCVDRGDCELLRSYKFRKTFFFPHAVEAELIQPPDGDRPIDIIMLGTCYDPDTLYAHWKATYPKKTVKVLEGAVSKVLSDNHTRFDQALLQSLASNGVDPADVAFDQLAYYVDSYSRGIDRLNLIRSIKGIPIHVYGGACWREIQPVREWQSYLAKQPNVTVHPPVNFADAMKLLQKSKVCLNSMPFFKDGTHERVFSALACGAVPLTTDTKFLRETFVEGEELLFYQPRALDNIEEGIRGILSDKGKWGRIVRQGQAKVKKHHTWDGRADFALSGAIGL